MTNTPLNAIISNNMIGVGTDTSGNNYHYFTGIDAGTSAKVVGNIVGGIGSSTYTSIGTIINSGNTTIMNLEANTNCIITDNVFIRGSNSLYAYINVLSTNPQVITNNNFDSPTIDGTNLALVANLSDNSTYYQNKNQTVVMPISLVDYSHYYSPKGTQNTAASTTAFPEATIISDDSQAFGATYNIGRLLGVLPGNFGASYTVVNETGNSTSTSNYPRNFACTIPLDYILPPNVTVISASIGIYLVEVDSASLENTGSSNPEFAYTNAITLSVNSSYGTNNNSISPTQGILDVKANVNGPGWLLPFSFRDSTQVSNNYQTIFVNDVLAGTSGSGYTVVSEATMTSATQYLNLTNINVQTANTYKVWLEFDLNYKAIVFNTTGTPYIQWLLSPVVLSYRW